MPEFPPTRLYTVEDVRAIPDDLNRYEVIDGELFVTPAPGTRHQRVLRDLFRILDAYVTSNGLGEVLFAPTDVVFGETTMVEPDLLFIRKERAGIVTERDLQGAPDLAVEVLSPSTKRTDRHRKRALYQEQGVSEYWVVDPDLQQIEVWRPGAVEAVVCRDTLAWKPNATVAALEVDVAAVFGGVE